MKTFLSLLAVALLLMLFGAAVKAQTYDYGDGRKLQIEFVQEPPCPIKLSVKKVDLKWEPNAQLITLQMENVSSTPIRAYALVSGGNVHPNVHTVTFGGAPFDPGKPMLRGVWPNSQEHYYFFFDYILFTDGSVCGIDNQHRSIQIKSYLDSYAAAVSRLKELAAEITDSNEIIAAIENGGSYLSFDSSGPPNPETVKRMSRAGYDNVILQLRQMHTREKDARILADLLEKEARIRFAKAD